MAVAGRAALASGGNMKGSHHFSGYVPERNLIHTYGPLGSSLAEQGFKLGPFGTGRANGLPSISQPDSYYLLFDLRFYFSCTLYLLFSVDIYAHCSTICLYQGQQG